VDHRFGRTPAFALGLEEELLLVDPATRMLAHEATRRIAAARETPGEIKPDTYEAEIELAAPVAADAGEARRAIADLRAAVRDAGATLMGAGIHPAGDFGDVVHVDDPRYAAIAESVRGLLRRTPTCALHVHVSMPDAASAIRAYNRLRAELPLLQALAANSPFWHGRDSGLATARSVLFRGYPNAEIPRAFRDYDDYEETTAAVVAAGELADYTFLWWDIRPHPRLGTVELRAMDSQASLGSAAGLTALVQALARAALEAPEAPLPPREALTVASFRAARDGLEARAPDSAGTVRPMRELAADALRRAAPHARELNGEAALEEIERILREGNGADRQRAAYQQGGMEELLRLLVEETSRA
jgi:carboxylate-amine ligase